MIRFCHNHGLIQIANRPQWRTVRGGSRHYVEKIVAGLSDTRLNTPVRRITRSGVGVRVATDAGTEHFDHVVLATHCDQSLALLGGASPAEAAVLGAIRYQANHAVLHTDAAVLPQRRSAWAAWNYERAAAGERESGRVCLHYLLNKLQPLPWAQPVVVSLNPVREIQRSQVMAEYDYDHPVLDLAAIRAQAEVPALQGQRNTWFAGAWMGYGFHEDGLKAGLAAAQGLRAHLAGLNAPIDAMGVRWHDPRRSRADPADGIRRGAPCPLAPGAQRLRLPDLFPDAADARPARGAATAWRSTAGPRCRSTTSTTATAARPSRAARWPGSTSCWPPTRSTTPPARPGCTATRACSATPSSR
jgi:hypothetical protein